MMEFEDLLEACKEIESKAGKNIPFEEVDSGVPVVSPKMTEKTYEDLLNSFKRVQKIASVYEKLSSVYSVSTPIAKPIEGREKTAKAEEITKKIQEIKEETVKSIEEEKEKVEAVPPAAVIQRPSPEIEFEEEREELGKLEKEKPPVEAISKPSKEIIPKEIKEGKEGAKVEEIKERIDKELKGVKSPQELKKRMLELTRELLNPKTPTGRKEEIKKEIKLIKSMLSALSEAKRERIAKGMEKPTKGKKGKLQETIKPMAKRKALSTALVETVLEEQERALGKQKDLLFTMLNNELSDLKSRFENEISLLPDPTKRKELYTKLISETKGILSKYNSLLNNHKKLLIKRHKKELEKLMKDEKISKTLKEKISSRLSELSSKYDSEFSNIEELMSKKITSFLEREKSLVEGVPKEEDKFLGIIREIEDTDEGTLLYYLHSKDLDIYKSYERHRISKEEALWNAKRLMAEEKGVPKEIIEKYFGSYGDHYGAS